MLTREYRPKGMLGSPTGRAAIPRKSRPMAESCIPASTVPPMRPDPLHDLCVRVVFLDSTGSDCVCCRSSRRLCFSRWTQTLGRRGTRVQNTRLATACPVKPPRNPTRQMRRPRRRRSTAAYLSYLSMMRRRRTMRRPPTTNTRLSWTPRRTPKNGVWRENGSLCY